MKEYFDESLKSPCFALELVFFEDSLRVISSDGLSNISIHKILQIGKNPNGKTTLKCKLNLNILQERKLELEKAADLHFGTKINKFRKVSDKENNLKRFFFCSQDGKIGEVIPLREYDQKKLLVNLQNELSEKLPFTGGLNPKEFRYSIFSVGKYY